MKALPVIPALLFLSGSVIAQHEEYKRVTLRSHTDSFSILPFWPEKMPIVANDTAGYGTNFYKTIFIVKTDLDSAIVQFDPVKKPYQQTTWIKIASPDKSQVLAINFNEVVAEFSPVYIKNYTGKAQFDIPEAYELANILYALTKSSAIDSNRTFKQSSYYHRVLDYFRPWLNHPLLKELEFGDDLEGANGYYNFRENSFCFRFEKNKLTRNFQYNVVSGDIKNNLFEKLLPLVNDFAQKSGFQKFYAANTDYYRSQVTKAMEIMPARKMWDWLENNFQNKFDSYRVVFSPLIWGSHSTQQFWWAVDLDKWFKETVMFVGGPGLFMMDSTLSIRQKEGLASGMLFTEIDHNYVNPVSAKYGKQIDSIFKDLHKWLSKDGDAVFYQSPGAVFNEYMTHAAFVLYAYDNFSNHDFEFIKAKREDLMVKRRKYFRFKEFDEELLRLYKARSNGQKLEDLFDDILKWAAGQ